MPAFSSPVVLSTSPPQSQRQSQTALPSFDPLRETTVSFP